MNIKKQIEKIDLFDVSDQVNHNMFDVSDQVPPINKLINKESYKFTR